MFFLFYFHVNVLMRFIEYIKLQQYSSNSFREKKSSYGIRTDRQIDIHDEFIRVLIFDICQRNSKTITISLTDGTCHLRTKNTQCPIATYRYRKGRLREYQANNITAKRSTI